MQSSEAEFQNEDNTQCLKRPLGQVHVEGDYIPSKKSVTTPPPFPVLDNSMKTITDTYPVPESVVGLVIGKGGSEIRNIQLLSGCHVQMSPDNTAVNGIRDCFLEGTPQTIERAKDLISQSINRQDQINRATAGTEKMIEMSIAPDKCGLIIGKAGETIKNLQEQSGCRMNIVQDSQAITGKAKPLRIIGTPDAIDMAKRLVQEILDNSPGINVTQAKPSNSYTNNNYGNNNSIAYDKSLAKGEVIVPRLSAGMIIGKGGEMIKRLSMETGTKIQFKPDDDPNSPERVAIIMGTREQIYSATEKITAIVNRSVMMRSSISEETVYYMHVPSKKCGLVIGKGGETIKQIENDSGAYCALAKGIEHKDEERVFELRGSPYQVHQATHLVRIKVGDVPPNTPIPPMAGQSQSLPNMNQHYSQQPQQQSQQQYSSNYPIMQHSPQPLQQQQYVPNGMQQTAWGGQPVVNTQPPMIQQPQTQHFQQTYTPPSTTTAPPQGQYMPTKQIRISQIASDGIPVYNPTTGQADYSIQWAQYYRSLGLTDQAAMVENQMKRNMAKAACPSPNLNQAPHQQFYSPSSGNNQVQ